MNFFYWLAMISAVFCLGIIRCDRPNYFQSADASSTIYQNEVPSIIEATLTNDVAKVKSLLQSGVDPNTIYNTNTALTYAARDGSTKIASLLIENGADVNWIDGEGVTPLILASFQNHLDIVKLLLQQDADQTVRDRWNRNALDYALRRGKQDPIVRLLQTAKK